MNQVNHPSLFIPSSLTDIVRVTAAEAEKLKCLHPSQLEIIYEQKWFSLFVPVAYGGLELSLPEALCIEEGLAWADGSTGWTVTLCSGANWFIGFFPTDLAQKVFNNRKVCLAGSGKASGTAKITGDGFEISGCWNYATGASHATAFTANCIIEMNESIVRNKDGSPQVKSFLFLRDEVMIHEDWSVMGMIATASHSFEVNKLLVDKNRCFEISRDSAFLPHPVYRYPFQQFAEATLAVNSSGMAMAFIDTASKLFAGRTMPPRNHPSVDQARATLQEARQLFYDSVHQSWSQCETEGIVADELLYGVSKASRTLAKTALELVDGLYPYCGLAAANPVMEINRVWRNLHTASQHSLLIYDAG